MTVFAGAAASFHEWQFRLQIKKSLCTAEELPALTAKVVDALRGEALSTVGRQRSRPEGSGGSGGKGVSPSSGARGGRRPGFNRLEPRGSCRGRCCGRRSERRCDGQRGPLSPTQTFRLCRFSSSVGSWSVERGAHIQAFTFSSKDHGRLSIVLCCVWRACVL